MNEISISGDTLIFDGSETLDAYFSIRVGQGLDISNNTISIDDNTMNNIGSSSGLAGYGIDICAGEISTDYDVTEYEFNFLTMKEDALKNTGSIDSGTVSSTFFNSSSLNDTHVGRDLHVNGDIHLQGEIVKSGQATFYGFQVTSDVGYQTYDDNTPKLEFNFIPPSSKKYYCVPDINHFDLIDHSYIVPIDGIYQFGVSTLKQITDGQADNEGGIGLYLNSSIIVKTGSNELSSGKTTCTAWCQQGDRITVETDSSDGVIMNEGKSIFYGYLIQSMQQP